MGSCFEAMRSKIFSKAMVLRSFGWSNHPRCSKKRRGMIEGEGEKETIRDRHKTVLAD